MPEVVACNVIRSVYVLIKITVSDELVCLGFKRVSTSKSSREDDWFKFETNLLVIPDARGRLKHRRKLAEYINSDLPFSCCESSVTPTSGLAEGRSPIQCRGGGRGPLHNRSAADGTFLGFESRVWRHWLSLVSGLRRKAVTAETVLSVCL